MALIRKFERLADSPIGFRTEVDCGWRVGQVGGDRILHLETYGSTERERTGKVSQAIELNEDQARELQQILRLAFPEPG